MTIEMKLVLLFVLMGFAIPVVGIATIRSEIIQNILNVAMIVWGALMIIGAAVFIIMS